MIYLEYNLKKNEELIEYVNYEVSSSIPEFYELIPMQKNKIIHPKKSIYSSNSLYPISINKNVSFISNYNLGTKNYYFEYNNKYYLFSTEIKKKNILTFDGNILKKNYVLENNKFLKLIDSITITKSSQNVEFSSLKVDFSNCIKEELPYALQEVRIWSGNQEKEPDKLNLLYTGYVEDYKLPKMINYDDDVILELSILSPMSLTTKRYISLSGVYSSIKLMNLLFEPLINDGFILKEVNIVDKQIQVNYFLETIETIANDLSNKLNFFWYIDESKNILINNIESLFNQSPVIKIYGDDKIKGLYSFVPSIESNDYFNTINIKNARVYCTGFSTTHDIEYKSNQFPILKNLTLNTDDEIEFESPIDTSITGLETLCSERQTENQHLDVLYISSQNTDFLIGYSKGDNKLILPKNVVFDDDETTDAIIVLKRDSFFKSLITGFKWQGQKTNLNMVWSDSMLKYQTFKMMNSIEIEKCKGLISNSGIIEKTVDFNESWFTKKELIEYCRNLMSSNCNETSDLELSFDEDYGFNIGDLISVNKPKFMTSGDFIITSIQNSISTNNNDFVVKTKNSKLNDTYIDLFRSTKTHDDDEKYDISNIIEYTDEGIVERYGVIK